MASPSLCRRHFPGSGGPLEEGWLRVVVIIRAVVRVRGTSRRHHGGGGSRGSVGERNRSHRSIGRARSNSGFERAEAKRSLLAASPQRTGAMAHFDGDSSGNYGVRNRATAATAGRRCQIEREQNKLRKTGRLGRRSARAGC
ncbi:hypothetical protein MTO96_028363 [Rhipicephalus appendiculatus]